MPVVGVGVQVFRAISIALLVLSNSVRKTLALDEFPVSSASARSAWTSLRFESRWIIGHKSVAIPSSVSTELNGVEASIVGENGDIACGVLDIGDVPHDRADITS